MASDLLLSIMAMRPWMGKSTFSDEHRGQEKVYVIGLAGSEVLAVPVNEHEELGKVIENRILV